MRIASDELLTIPACQELLSRSGGDYVQAMLDDPICGTALRVYVVLTEAPELLSGQGLTSEEIFYSRYYWLVRFSQLWQTLNGYDAGLEDQEFRLLEHPHPECAPNWCELEQLRDRVMREVAEDVGRNR